MKLRLGEFVVGLESRELLQAGVPVPVEPKVFELLAFLLRNRGRVVGREELMHAIWPDVATTSGSLNRAVSLAREALDDRSRSQPIIETVRGLGYRISHAVEWVEEESGDAFVGRATEMSVLAECLGRVLRGRGGTVVLSGDAGIGKSRLAEEFAADARARGANPLWGRCQEGGGRPAFWPWSQVLRALVADEHRPERELGEAALLLGEAPAPPGASRVERFRTFEAVARLLAAASARQPLVLLFDDLHWADQSSLQLLAFVAAGLRGERILLVASHREREGGAVLEEALAEASRGGWRRDLRLRGFDQAEVSRFLRALSGNEPRPVEVESALRRTDGNPLFLQELARHASAEGSWKGPVPESARQVIRTRLSQLPRDCVDLLSMASIVGRRFPVRLVALVAGCREDEALDCLDPALRAGTVELEVPGDGLRFRHELMREVLYEDLPAGARARAHLRVAEALEGLSSRGVSSWLSELAHHFREGVPAGGAEKALDYALRAAAAQSEQLAFEEAVGHLEGALELIDARIDADARTRARLLIDLGNARKRAGDLAGAEQAFWTAMDSARALGQAELHAEAAADLASFRGMRSLGQVPERRIEALETALRELSEEDADIRARVLGGLSADLYWVDLERSSALSQEGLAMARRLGDPDTLLNALDRRHDLLAVPEHETERKALTDEMLELAHARGSSDMEYQAQWYRVRAAMIDGEAESFERELAALCTLADRSRQPVRLAEIDVLRGARALWQGNLAEAEARVSPQFEAELERAGGHRLASFVPQLSQLRQLQGRIGETSRMLEEGFARFPRVLTFECAMLFSWIHQRERLGEAARRLERLVASGFSALRRDLAEAINLALLSETAAATRNREAATFLFDRLGAYEGRHLTLETYVSLGSAARYQGLLAELQGDLDSAIAYQQAARDAERRMQAPLWECRAERELARLLDAAGDRAAPQHARRARELEASLGVAL